MNPPDAFLQHRRPISPNFEIQEFEESVYLCVVRIRTEALSAVHNPRSSVSSRNSSPNMANANLESECDLDQTNIHNNLNISRISLLSDDIV